MKKYSYITIVLLMVAQFTLAQSLKEKQAMAELDFSWSEKRILDNLGATVKIELNKESFAGDYDAILYADSRGAQTVANAIAKITYNKIGKEELAKKKITKVILKNSKTEKESVSIINGVLTLTCGYSSDRYFSESNLQAAIENLL